MIVNCDQFFDKRGFRTRGHKIRLKKKTAKRDVSKQFFSARIVDKWNSPSDEILEAKCIQPIISRQNMINRMNSSCVIKCRQWFKLW